MRRSSLLMFMVVLGGLGYLLYARMHRAVPPMKPAHLALIVDNSISQHVDCASMPALVKAMPRGMQLGNGSTVSVFTLGSKEKSSFEPVQQLPPTPIGGGGSNFGKHDLEERVRSVCAHFGEVPKSSIYRAVRVVLDHLKTLGCGSPNTPPCRLWLRSDMDETVSIERFRGANGAASLTNQGTEVVICDYAVAEGGGGPRGDKSDHLIDAWRANFTNPEIVTFMPFCPGKPEQTAAN